MYVVETRELTQFIAVAEQQHFGRAADRLGMAQPPVSRAIRQLERRLGVQLLRRTTRSVELTAAGMALLVEGRKALAAMKAAGEAARRAGADTRRLRVVTKPEGDGGLLQDILPRYSQEPDALDVELIVCRKGEQAEMLRDGRADVGFLNPPHDDLDGFDSDLLMTQRQVAIVARGHRLAARASIHLIDLDAEPLPVWPARRPADGRGPSVQDPAQLLTLVALGQVVAVVPQSVRRFGRTDVVAVPVLDAPHSQVVLAWPRETRSRSVAAFCRAGRAAVDAPASTRTSLTG